jgi:hypothetical protein
LPALALLGCGSPEAHVTKLDVVMHELGQGCAISAAEDAAPSEYVLALTALGPFAAEGSDYARNVPLDDVTGRELAFDARAVGVDAVVTLAEAELSAGPPFTGHSERRRSSGIDVLLWPSGRACSVAPGPYPGGNGGQAFGYSAHSGLVLAAGEDVSDETNEQSAGPGSALAFDVDRGTATLVPREGALQIPRAFATVTELGADLLVAGGENPLGASSLDAAGTAEVFSTSELAFTTTVALTLHRARHAAVTLPATGETLLVGGYEPEPDAPDLRPREIRLFEAISPALRASTSGLAQLEVGRIDPTALVLTDGRLFVGGGTFPGEDQARVAEGAPVGLVEVFSADARTALLHPQLPDRPRRSFAALPGGGVLTVASCNDDAENQRTDCACFTPEGEQCDADGAWLEGSWLAPEGVIEPVAFVVEGSARCGTPYEPQLAPGSDGSPWLVGSPADGGPPCLWRFQPWPGESPSSSGDARMPRFVPSDVALDPPPDPGTRLVSLGPDAFVWIGGGDAHGLAGAALGHRGTLTRDAELLTAAPGEPRPEHLAPDRNPNPPAGPIRRARATFDANNRLKLEPPEPPEPPLTVWVADTTYGDCVVSLALAPPTGTADVASTLPVLAFGGSTAGDAECPWPAPAGSSRNTGPLFLTATRTATDVTLALSGVSTTTRCNVATGPLAIGVRAGAGDTMLVSLVIGRR